MANCRQFTIALCLTAALAGGAGGAEFRLGQIVFWKPGAVAKVGERSVSIDQIPFGDLVGAVNGEWLWVRRGWIRQSDLQTLEEALEDCSGRIELDPVDATAYLRRGSVWKCRGDYDRAFEDFTRAIRLDPDNAVCHATRGAARVSQGNYEAAIDDCTTAILLDRRCAVAYRNRGAAWGHCGRFDHALNDMAEAIRLDPHDALAYRNRGAIFQRQGQYANAVADCTQALRLDQTCLEAWNDSAWLRATCPDAKFRNADKALDSAQKACELSAWKDGHCLGTLAAAYAERGQFDEAQDWQSKAIALARSPADQQDERERLNAYAAHRPLREDLVHHRFALPEKLRR